MKSGNSLRIQKLQQRSTSVFMECLEYVGVTSVSLICTLRMYQYHPIIMFGYLLAFVDFGEREREMRTARPVATRATGSPDYACARVGRAGDNPPFLLHLAPDTCLQCSFLYAFTNKANIRDTSCSGRTIVIAASVRFKLVATGNADKKATPRGGCTQRPAPEEVMPHISSQINHAISNQVIEALCEEICSEGQGEGKATRL